MIIISLLRIDIGNRSTAPRDTVRVNVHSQNLKYNMWLHWRKSLHFLYQRLFMTVPTKWNCQCLFSFSFQKVDHQKGILSHRKRINPQLKDATRWVHIQSIGFFFRCSMVCRKKTGNLGSSVILIISFGFAVIVHVLGCNMSVLRFRLNSYFSARWSGPRQFA